MADRLVADGWVTSPVVEKAFRAVPRHLFVPDGTLLEDAYAADLAPIAKKDSDGTNISSVSAAWLQARMIAQAGIEPGMRVLEIGSGGYNAALLSEATGSDGLVVTMDIDPEITAKASGYLDAAGYADRITVVTADGENGVPDHGPYDAIIVTAGAWDIPPAWQRQLADKGTLVLPLRMNMITRSLGFRRVSDHWQSMSAEICGFVPFQGIGARPEPLVRIPDPDGGHVELRFDQNAPDNPRLLDGALASEPVTRWSGVTIANATTFADLHLWFAGFLPGFCKVAASEDSSLGAKKAVKNWFPYGGILGDSFACQVMRNTGQPGDGEWEFGAGAYGPHAADAADAFLAEVRAWDQHGRDLPGDAFTYWPAGSVPERAELTSVFPKMHGALSISWLAAR
jgi:protein-L-isoaspartate(D-aspartate) O-methyltransferase